MVGQNEKMELEAQRKDNYYKNNKNVYLYFCKISHTGRFFSHTNYMKIIFSTGCVSKALYMILLYENVRKYVYSIYKYHAISQISERSKFSKHLLF